MTVGENRRYGLDFSGLDVVTLSHRGPIRGKFAASHRTEAIHICPLFVIEPVPSHSGVLRYLSFVPKRALSRT